MLVITYIGSYYIYRKYTFLLFKGLIFFFKPLISFKKRVHNLVPWVQFYPINENHCTVTTLGYKDTHEMQQEIGNVKKKKAK